MNDKTSIFLCFFLRQHFPHPPASQPQCHPPFLPRYTYKKFICKMRQRIDGISAHESSNGNRILCLKGISFHFCFFRFSFSFEIVAERVEHHAHCEMSTRRINSHANEYIKAFQLLNCNCEICQSTKLQAPLGIMSADKVQNFSVSNPN